MMVTPSLARGRTPRRSRAHQRCCQAQQPAKPCALGHQYPPCPCATGSALRIEIHTLWLYSSGYCAPPHWRRDRPFCAINRGREAAQPGEVGRWARSDISDFTWLGWAGLAAERRAILAHQPGSAPWLTPRKGPFNVCAWSPQRPFCARAVRLHTGSGGTPIERPSERHVQPCPPCASSPRAALPSDVPVWGRG